MCGNLGLKSKAGSGTPGREVRHEGTCLVGEVKHDLTCLVLRHLFTLVSTDRNNGDLKIVTNRHGNGTNDVVVNNNTCSACLTSVLYLLLEGDVTTLYECDLALHLKAGIVDLVAVSGNGYVLELCMRVILIDTEHLEEVVLLQAGVVRFSIENYEIAVSEHIVFLTSVDRANGQCCVVGRGSTYGRGVGVGNLVGITLRAAVTASVVVGCSNDKRNARRLDSIVQTVLIIVVNLTGKSAGCTKAHVDRVNTKNYAVLKRCKDIYVLCTVGIVTEYLHDCKLGVNSNTGDNVVLTADNASYVSTVALREGHNVRIVICIVVAEYDLVVGDVTVVKLSCLK